MHFIQHHAVAIIIGWYVYSAAVSALPSPLPNERWYQFSYVMLHTLAGSLARAGATIYPQAFKAQDSTDNSVDNMKK